MAISKCSIIARIIFSAIGAFVGVSIFVTFGTHYHNYDAAIWGLFSGFAAFITLMIHIGYKRNGLVDKESFLSILRVVGCFVFVAGFAAFIAYLTVAIIEQQSLTPYGPRGYYLACVWAAMTCKWGFLLYHFSRIYLVHLSQDESTQTLLSHT